MPNPENFGAFIETTPIYNIQSLDPNSPDFKLFLTKLRQDINNIALLLNIKVSGYYPLTEFVSGKLFFPDPSLNSLSPQPPTYRQGFITSVICGALPNTGTINIPHGLSPTNTWSTVEIRGSATDPVGLNYISLPYSSPILANNISVDVDATNVSITTGSNRSNFTISYIILEYIKS